MPITQVAQAFSEVKHELYLLFRTQVGPFNVGGFHTKGKRMNLHTAVPPTDQLENANHY